MLTIDAARIVKKALDDAYAPRDIPLSLEDVCKMQLLPTNTTGEDYFILGIQTDNLSILVRVKSDEMADVQVLDVKFLTW